MILGPETLEVQVAHANQAVGPGAGAQHAAQQAFTGRLTLAQFVV
jgi:hypothetical protein